MKGFMCCLILILTVATLVAFATRPVEARMFEPPVVGPDDFVSVIDNPYLPLEPGTTFVYEAETEDEFILNHVTVTNDTKVILGVTCTVVFDVEWVDGVLMEETFDWFAQDEFGNVWYFGEDTTEYLYDEAGNFLGTSKEGSWEAGVDGAVQGIIMPANPLPGLSYRQEFYEGVAEDMARNLRLNATVSVEYGDFGDCLQNMEWTPLAPGEVELKYYALGVGLVLIQELMGKTVRVELVDVIN